MSREGGAKEPIPLHWLSCSKDDYRHAYLGSIGSPEEQRTLGNQAFGLVERIDESRRIYRDLLEKWESEKVFRARR